jgi:regulator of sigma E protease
MELQKALEILIMAGQLILGLSILVGLHEWGHMAAAKMFGMRVEKYFIGFPPKIFSFQKGETEYGIGAIPLGGFVKISGMIDESMDTEAMSQEPQPWEFRSKPAWQRLIVMLGGIIVNVIVGIIIFIAIAYHDGKKFLSIDEVNKYGIVAGELAQELGLKTGDKVIRVNGKPFNDYNDLISSEVFLGSNSSYTVLRNGQEVQIEIPNNFIEKLSDPDEKRNFILPLEPFKIGELIPGMPAEAAGFAARRQSGLHQRQADPVLPRIAGTARNARRQGYHIGGSAGCRAKGIECQSDRRRNAGLLSRNFASFHDCQLFFW